MRLRLFRIERDRKRLNGEARRSNPFHESLADEGALSLLPLTGLNVLTHLVTTAPAVEPHTNYKQVDKKQLIKITVINQRKGQTNYILMYSRTTHIDYRILTRETLIYHTCRQERCTNEHKSHDDISEPNSNDSIIRWIDHFVDGTSSILKEYMLRITLTLVLLLLTLSQRMNVTEQNNNEQDGSVSRVFSQPYVIRYWQAL